MIHLTLILVDFLTGLIMAGAWALLMAGGVIAALLSFGLFGLSRFKRRK